MTNLYHGASFNLPKPHKFLLRIDGGRPDEPGLYVGIHQRPTRFHEWMMRLCFGWRVTTEPENDRPASNG